MNKQARQACEVYGYIRVSLKRQMQGASLDEQKRVIIEFCERRNLKVIGFIQDVQTAATSGRKNFEKMMGAIKRGQAGGIVFHKVDRSSRNYHDWLAISELMDAGLYVAFASEGLESSDPSGRFTMDILAATAIHYIRNLRSETKKGMRGRIEQGLWPLPAPIGYLEPPQGTPKDQRCRKRLDPIRAPLIRELITLYAAGDYTLERLQEEMRRRGLTTRTGKPLSVSRIAAVLDNPFYAGLLPYEGRLFHGKHPALIDLQLFERVRELRNRKMHAMETRHSHLLQQLLTCAECQRLLTPEIQKGKTYYRCHNKKHPSTSIREELVGGPIFELLNRIHPSANELVIMRAMLEKEIHRASDITSSLRQNIQLTLNKLASQRQRAVDGYLNGILSEEIYKAQESKLLIEEKKQTEQLAKLSEPSNSDTVAKALRLFELLGKAYINAKKPAQRQLLRATCSNFSVSGKNVSIEPRKWIQVAAEREEFLYCSPSRQKLRTCNEFIEKLTAACLQDRSHIESAAEIVSSVLGCGSSSQLSDG